MNEVSSETQHRIVMAVYERYERLLVALTEAFEQPHIGIGSTRPEPRKPTKASDIHRVAVR